jgi:benzoate transport
MSMLDGMDVLVISYAAPAIATDWVISPEALGVVFSAGLAGMTLGTLLIAPMADRIGRKSIILFSGVLMGCCIYLTSYAQDTTQLFLYRFFSGLGIGSMLASTTSLTAEYTPEKSRDFWVSFVIAGYPVGAVLSGLVAASVVPVEGWRYLFQLAGGASLAAIPVAYFFLSESTEYYLGIQPRHALRNLNKILVRMKVPQLDALPVLQVSRKRIPVKQLFQEAYRQPTFLLWIALFMAFAALYYLISWIPKLANDAGLSMELAIYAGAVFNIGAFVGILTQGYYSSKFGLKRTIGIIFICTSILMAVFGIFLGSDILLLLIALLGFGIQGGFVGLYAVAARLYPASFRTTGIGWAMGAGRFGGIVGPTAGGLLIGLGFGITASFMFFAIPTLIAGLLTLRITSPDIR